MQGTPFNERSFNEGGFYTQLQEGLTQWLTRLGYAESTTSGHNRRIGRFLAHLRKEGITRLEEVTAQTIEGYQKQVELLPVKSGTIASHISSLRLFDRYLESYGYRPIITTKLRTTPHMETPKTILSQEETQQLYKATDSGVSGYRDRAMLAIYYGCGLRASEGVDLQIGDLDFKSNLLQVRKSKTYRPRYVPMGGRVQEDLKEWLAYGRPLALKVASDHVLVHSKGHYKGAAGFNDRLKKLAETAGITKDITLHGLRHSIATHLLENGMALEQIRQFLGHHSLEVTQGYTHLVYEQF